MNKIKYDVNLMKFIHIFETLTRASVKDCIEDKNKNLIFIVGENQIGKAIGKGASNIKRVQEILKRRIRVVEYSKELKEFIRHLIYPLIVDEIIQDDGVITLVSNDNKTKGLLIGRNLQNLKETENVISRYFPITSLKVK